MSLVYFNMTYLCRLRSPLFLIVAIVMPQLPPYICSPRHLAHTETNFSKEFNASTSYYLFNYLNFLFPEEPLELNSKLFETSICPAK